MFFFAGFCKFEVSSSRFSFKTTGNIEFFKLKECNFDGTSKEFLLRFQKSSRFDFFPRKNSSQMFFRTNIMHIWRSCRKTLAESAKIFLGKTLFSLNFLQNSSNAVFISMRKLSLSKSNIWIGKLFDCFFCNRILKKRSNFGLFSPICHNKD